MTIRNTLAEAGYKDKDLIEERTFYIDTGTMSIEEIKNGIAAIKSDIVGRRV